MVNKLKGNETANKVMSKNIYANKVDIDKFDSKRRGEHDYDKIAEKHGGRPWKAQFDLNIKNKFSGITSPSGSKISYGDVRNLMLERGVLHLYDEPIRGAITQSSYILQ